jgi:hypothetical protein
LGLSFLRSLSFLGSIMVNLTLLVSLSLLGGIMVNRLSLLGFLSFDWLRSFVFFFLFG